MLQDRVVEIGFEPDGPYLKSRPEIRSDNRGIRIGDVIWQDQKWTLVWINFLPANLFDSVTHPKDEIKQ
jgi:hypothetical protein